MLFVGSSAYGFVSFRGTMETKYRDVLVWKRFEIPVTRVSRDLVLKALLLYDFLDTYVKTWYAINGLISQMILDQAISPDLASLGGTIGSDQRRKTAPFPC